jgi:hypothetical protein
MKPLQDLLHLDLPAEIEAEWEKPEPDLEYLYQLQHALYTICSRFPNTAHIPIIGPNGQVVNGAAGSSTSANLPQGHNVYSPTQTPGIWANANLPSSQVGTTGQYGSATPLTPYGYVYKRLKEVLMWPYWDVQAALDSDDFLIFRNMQAICVLPFAKADHVLATSVSDEEALRKFEEFFGLTVQPLPDLRSPEQCYRHEWIEVTLFHTPHERCRYCDIKRSEVKE